MPDKATKHIPKHRQPVGAVKDGRVKIQDGYTKKISWRQGTKGMSRDWDGDPIATNYNYEGLKNRPQHHAKKGSRRTHKPKM